MKTIYKYPLPCMDTFFADLPKGAEILTVQVQNGTAAFWAICDLLAEKEFRKFEVVGTGHELRDLNRSADRKYIGTFQLYGGGFVGHLFELVKAKP